MYFQNSSPNTYTISPMLVFCEIHLTSIHSTEKEKFHISVSVLTFKTAYIKPPYMGRQAVTCW